MGKPCLIDLFSGIGSASLGFRKAGFEVVAALDVDPMACEIYEKNLEVKPLNEDIRQAPGRDILNAAGVRRGEVDAVIGCPPCQGFSTLRRTTRDRMSRDNRNSLVRVFTQRIEEILPRVVVFENVPGMLWGSYRRYLRLLTAELRRLGYSSVTDVLDAADFGVPQFRKRVIVLAARKDLAGKLRMPSPTHFPPEKAQGADSRWLTVRDRISDLPPLRAGEGHSTIPLHAAPNHSEKTLEIISRIPKDGGSRRKLPKELWLPCHRTLGRGAENVYGRMRWDEPSPTITTRCHNPSSGRFIHPEQDRAITLREAARLQTIPDDFCLYGCKEHLGVWIGNAMPTRLGEVVGAHVTKLLV